jgi:hypothetical protein
MTGPWKRGRLARVWRTRQCRDEKPLWPPIGTVIAWWDTETQAGRELLSGYVTGPGALTDVEPADIELIGAYRFDDPAGDVGIETHLLDAVGGPVLQVPVTYRSAPVDGAETSLIGTIDHSTLGPRWVYDATNDPIYVRELLRVMLTGSSEVEQYFETSEGREVRDPTATIIGSGNATAEVPTGLTFSGNWSTGAGVLAYIR